MSWLTKNCVTNIKAIRPTATPTIDGADAALALHGGGNGHVGYPGSAPPGEHRATRPSAFTSARAGALVVVLAKLTLVSVPVAPWRGSIVQPAPRVSVIV